MPLQYCFADIRCLPTLALSSCCALGCPASSSCASQTNGRAAKPVHQASSRAACAITPDSKANATTGRHAAAAPLLGLGPTTSTRTLTPAQRAQHGGRAGQRGARVAALRAVASMQLHAADPASDGGLGVCRPDPTRRHSAWCWPPAVPPDSQAPGTGLVTQYVPGSSGTHRKPAKLLSDTGASSLYREFSGPL